MKTAAITIALTLFAVAGSAAAGGKSHRSPGHGVGEQLFDYARVVDVQPRYRRIEVSEPVRECWEEPVYQTRNSAGGMLAGGLIGGIVGHQLGKGRGQRVATAVGTLIGAAVLDPFEDPATGLTLVMVLSTVARLLVVPLLRHMEESPCAGPPPPLRTIGVRPSAGALQRPILEPQRNDTR